MTQVENNYLQLCSNHFQMNTSRYLLAVPQSKRYRRSTCEFAHICIQLCKAKLHKKHNFITRRVLSRWTQNDDFLKGNCHVSYPHWKRPSWIQRGLAFGTRKCWTRQHLASYPSLVVCIWSPVCVHLPVTNEIGLGFLQFLGMPDCSYFKVCEPMWSLYRMWRPIL